MDEYRFMEDVISSVVTGHCKSYGANIVPINNLHPELVGITYSELYYNPQTANPWCYVRRGESITIWLIPK